MLPHILSHLITYSFNIYLLIACCTKQQGYNREQNKRVYFFCGPFNLVGETGLIPPVIFCCRTNYPEVLQHTISIYYHTCWCAGQLELLCCMCLSLFRDQQMTKYIFFSRQWQRNKWARGTTQAQFQPLLVLYPLTFHWPNWVTWPSPK